MKQKCNAILLLLAMVMLPALIFGQRAISGQVTDTETGETLIGANVLVVGTSTGTITDVDGNFELNVPAGYDQLSISYTGYATQEVEIGASNRLTISLSAGQILDEVVVIGYGTVKREDATGSVETISSESFNRGAITSTQELIAGKVAGVSISPSGDPGGGATIRIRGASSLSAVQSPLIVIDGVPVENANVAGARNILNLVNPNDVENVTVLKDASATAIYGSRASNGVIIITTKKGSLGKGVRLSYNGSIANSTITETIDVMSADQFRTYINDTRPDNADLLGTANTNWQDQIYQTALTHDHNVSASGAMGELPYRVSLGYTNKDGLLKTDNFQRLTYGVSLTPGFLDNTLQVTANFKGMNIQNQFANRGALGAAIGFDPTQPVFSGNEAFGGYYTVVDNNGNPNLLAPANPLAQLELKDDQSDVNRFIGNVQLDYRMPFLPELRANLNVGYDKSRGEGSIFEPLFYSPVANTGGTNNTYFEELTNELFDFYLNYVKEIGTSKVDVMAGYGYQHFRFDKESSDNNIAGDRPRFTPTAKEYFLVSLFSRVNVSLGKNLLLTGTVRRDGTSRFSEKNRYGIFPAAAMAYKFIGDNNRKGALNSFKVRLGWGKTGQQDLGSSISFYPYIPVYTTSQDNASYPFGDDFILTNRPGAYNEDLKWEETTTYNAAIDFGFLNNRISGSFEMYQRDTEDLLTINRPAAGTNLSNNIPANIGSLENKGFEVSLNIVPIQTEKAEWTLGVNMNRNRSEVTGLSLDDDPDFIGFETGGIGGGVGNNIQIHSVGFPLNSFFVYQQVYDEGGLPVEGLYVDRNGDGAITTADKYRLEQPAPDYFFGFTSNFNYGNFDFSFAGRANLGNYVYNNAFVSLTNNNGAYNSTGFLSNRHTDLASINHDVPQLFSDHFVENASFFRFDHFTAGYRINEVFGERGGSLRLYATLQNPLVITNYTGIDPEVFEQDKFGIDNDIYPRSRTILFGVNLNF